MAPKEAEPPDKGSQDLDVDLARFKLEITICDLKMSRIACGLKVLEHGTRLEDILFIRRRWPCLSTPTAACPRTRPARASTASSTWTGWRSRRWRRRGRSPAAPARRPPRTAPRT